MDNPQLLTFVTSGLGLASATVFGLLNIRETRRKAAAELAAEQRKTANERAGEKRKAINAQLTEFYGPLHYYLSVTKALYQPFRAGKPVGFRTLTYLLDPTQTYPDGGTATTVVLSESDHALLRRIIETEDKIEELIRTKGGLVDDRVLLSDYTPDPSRTDVNSGRVQKLGLLGLALTHYRVLKMAYDGELKGNPSAYSHLVYPRELDDHVERRMAELRNELAALN